MVEDFFGNLFVTILNACILGLGTGLGSTIGAYLSNKVVVKHLESIEKKLLVGGVVRGRRK